MDCVIQRGRGRMKNYSENLFVRKMVKGWDYIYLHLFHNGGVFVEINQNKM